jgi:small conductance mechanosensitive channel
MLLVQVSSGPLGDVARTLGIDLEVAFRRGVQIAAILALAWLANRLLRMLTRRFQQRFEREPGPRTSVREQRAHTLVQLLNSVGRVAIAVAASLTILNLFIAIGPLLAGVGVVGLAISFGAQSLVKDVISGFFILMENQFAVGDIVEVDGKAGVVERMTLRVVMLRDVEGALHIIPNGSITVVSNRSRDWSRAVLDVGVAYKESVDDVIRVMREVGRALWDDPEWRHKLEQEPEVWGVEGLADSSVNIRIAARTRPGLQFEVRRELRRRLKNRFDAEGIEIPFPQRMVHVADRAERVEPLRPHEAGEGASS